MRRRKTPDFSRFARPDANEPKKAVCSDTWKAPFPFEGSMLVFRALLVEPATKVYPSAKASPNFDRWQYRTLLEARLATTTASSP